MAPALNPCYSGGRDQEDHGSKPARVNISGDLIMKKTFTKRSGGVVQILGPEFKAQYHQ
jgi:hypothetical protein